MSDRRVKVIWEIDMFPADDESEYSIAKAVHDAHFSGTVDPDSACVFKVIEDNTITMVDLSKAEESREQRLERLAKLLLSQVKGLDIGDITEYDLTSDNNPVTRQLKAMLS